MDTDLRRFESYFFKPSDPGQVPLTGAVVYPTREGATVTEMVIFNEQEEHDVAVADAGYIQVGDILFMDTDTNVQLSVLSVSANRQSLTLQNYGGYTPVPAGARLRPATSPPAIFKDPRGLQPVSAVTVDSVGYAQFFTSAPVVDLAVSGGGLTAPLMLTNRACRRERGADSWRNALDFPSIQAAIDSLPAVGGTVFIPAGLYDLSETLYTPCDRPCHLLGEGSSRTGTKGTVLRWSVKTGMLRVRGDDSSVKGLTLMMLASGTAATEHEGYGIFVGRRNVVDAHPHPTTSPSATEYVKGDQKPQLRVDFEDLVVMDAPGWGLVIPGYEEDSEGNAEHGLVRPDVNQGGGTLSFWISVNRVQLMRSRRYGALFTGGGCTTIRFTEGACLLQGADQHTGVATCYAHLRGTTQPAFRDWIFEGASPADDPEGHQKPWVVLHGCDCASFEACWFEEDPHGPAGTDPYQPRYFLHLAGSNQSVTLSKLLMVRAGSNGGLLRCVYAEQGGVEGLYIDQPYAISSSPLTRQQGPPGHFVPIDSEAFVLNGEDEPESAENLNVFVRGAGIARNEVAHADAPDIATLPLTYAAVPLSATISNRHTLRTPLSTKAERTSGYPDNDAMLAQSGALAMEELAPGAVDSRALLFCSGGETRWRLANNLPALTTAQRTARGGWVTGDLVLNTTIPRVEVFDGSFWRAVSGILPLSEE